MKPKTIFQKRIVKLSEKVPYITETQRSWILNKMFKHHVYITKKQNECLTCSHVWKGNNYKKCPNCNRKLTMIENRKRHTSQKNYICILSTIEDMQVLRYYETSYYQKSKVKANLYVIGVCQHWITAEGKYCVMALQRSPNYYLNSEWMYSSNVEIRKNNSKYHITCDVYPRIQVLPIIKRNGFNDIKYPYDFSSLFQRILISSKAETLLKTKQYHILGGSRLSYITEELWAQVKICIRNNYIINNPVMWYDHMQTLNDLNLDLFNPKYICPEDLTKTHNHYVKKLREKRRKEKLEEMKATLDIDNEEYVKAKGKYFNIHLEKGNITVIPLRSVHEVLIEGDIMEHCVFENQYHKKPNSLLLSAMVDGQRCETVEMSIPDLTVRQSHGLLNSTTKHHESIINLINKNKRLIKKQIQQSHGKYNNF